MRIHRSAFRANVDTGDGIRFTLREVTDVVLSMKEAGLKADVIAEAMGETCEWVESLLALARDPVARALVNADRLETVGAWAAFFSLTPQLRGRILNSDEAISEWRCLRLKHSRQPSSAVGKPA